MIWIEEHARAFFVPVGVAVDVPTARCEAYAVELLEAALLDAPAQARARRAHAAVVLGTVGVLDARDPAIDAVSALARETENAVEARVTAQRGLDTALALLGYVHAVSTARTVRVAVASPTASKNASLDRHSLEAVASRLDADRTVETVVVRIAESLRRARDTKNAGRARNLRSARPAVTARIARSSVFATK
jgi:hypothetical protein